MKDPVPHYIPCYDGTYPFHLISVPDSHTLKFLFFLERDSLVENRGPMSLLLHPQDGAELGIQDGDPVTAWNDLAEVEFKAVFYRSDRQKKQQQHPACTASLLPGSVFR